MDCMITEAPAKANRGPQRVCKLFSWLMWHVSPNRYETPGKDVTSANDIAGIPQPASKAPQKNLRPGTAFQQIWTCTDRDRRKAVTIIRKTAGLILGGGYTYST